MSTLKDPYQETVNLTINHGGTISPKFIILHDSYGSFDGGVSWIVDHAKESQVSYHYLIDSDGSRTQMVWDSKKAWHAGSSSWKGYTSLNSHSIGVSFWGNTYQRTPTDTEIDSMAHKCAYLMDKFGIGIDGILTHGMISPDRKTDTSPETHKRVIKRVKKIIR